MNQKLEHRFPMKNALIPYKPPIDDRINPLKPTIEIPADAFADIKPIPAEFIDQRYREYLSKVERDIAARLGIPSAMFHEPTDPPAAT